MRVEPLIGHMVRVDDDEGTGTKGAIGHVDHRGLSNGVLYVGIAVSHVGTVWLESAHVTPVTYDSTTRTWSEVTQ